MVDTNNSKANRNVNVQGTGGSKKQEIVLIPLTKYYFPSPDCPLFVQFHKARCDAAVNYYFRRPGNPGDLSCIPHYGNPNQTELGDHHNNNSTNTVYNGDGGDGGNVNNINQTDYYNNNNYYLKENNSLSYPSREALYRGVIDHVEEMLFDTDAEMREAYLSQGSTVNGVESSQHASNAQQCNTVCLCEGSDVNNKNKGSDDDKLHTNEQIVRDQETETRQMELSGYIEEDSKTRSVVNRKDITSGKWTITEKETETDENRTEQAKNATYTSSTNYREELEQKQQHQQEQGKNTKTKTTSMTKTKKKQILPVLCAVAFRTHVGRSAQTTTHSNTNAASFNLHVDNMSNLQQQEEQQQKQIVSKEVRKSSDVYENSYRNNGHEIKAEPQYFVENGVYAFDSVINVVGCFGFVSMEEEVASYSNAMLAAVHSRTNSAEQSNKLHSRSTTDCNTNNNNYHTNNGNKSSNPSVISHNANAHGAHVNIQENNFGCNNDKLSSIELCSSSSPLPPIQETNTSITQSNINTVDNIKEYNNNNDNNDKSKKGCTSINKAALCDDLSLLSSAANHFNELMHLPPPIAAPLAAMVYLTKSAGEQNLSRITHLAACTYYYQLVHAGVLVSHSTQSTHGCNAATFTETTNTAPVVIPFSNITAITNNKNSNNDNKDDRYVSIDATEQTTKQSQANETMSKHKNNSDHDTSCMNEKNITHEPASSRTSVLFAATPCIERVLPPMDTFSFSVLLTNIPILSFLYEMK